MSWMNDPLADTIHSAVVKALNLGRQHSPIDMTKDVFDAVIAFDGEEYAQLRTILDARVPSLQGRRLDQIRQLLAAFDSERAEAARLRRALAEKEARVETHATAEQDGGRDAAIAELRRLVSRGYRPTSHEIHLLARVGELEEQVRETQALAKARGDRIDELQAEVREARRSGDEHMREYVAQHHEMRARELRMCTCLGTCRGADGLAPGWCCALAADLMALAHEAAARLTRSLPLGGEEARADAPEGRVEPTSDHTEARRPGT